MKIGDLFWQARVDASKIGLEAKAAGTKAGTTMGRAMQSPLAAQVKTGFGLGGGIAAFNVIGMAITKVTGFLGDSADAFRAEEKSVQKLSTSLEANVKGWDGNTRAIEEVLQSRLKLGFSDDEQRESLAGLLVATGDVTRALEIQRTAMDLARLKNISLAEATEALTKIEAGSFRILKSLGIELPKNATQTEALAAVQKAAAGQAEDYAQTLEGKLVVAEVKAGEASEKFGEAIANLQAIVLPAAADALTFFADGLKAIGDATEETTPALEKQAAHVEMLKFLFAGASPEIDKWIELEGEAAIAARETAEALAAQTTGVESMRGAIWGAGNAAGDAQAPVEGLTGELKSLEDQAAEAERAIDDLASTIVEELWGEAVRAGREQELRDQIQGVKDELAETTDKGDAIILKGQIAELTGELFELHLEQAAAQGPEAAIAFLKREAARAGDATGAIAALILQYQKLAGIQGQIGPIIPRLVDMDFGEGGRAHGGPVAPYTAYRVGERGEETLVMGSQPGYVLPDPMASTSSFAGLPGGGSSVNSSITNVNVQLPGLLRAESPADVMRTLRHLNVYGAFGDER